MGSGPVSGRGAGGGALAPGVNGQHFVTVGGVAGWADDIRQIQLTIDGGGAVITSGVKADCRVPWNCEILDWCLLGDILGTIQIDIWRDTYANYPPTVADTIIGGGGTKPNLTNQLANRDTGPPANWTVAIAADELLRFNVDADPVPANVTRVYLGLKVRLT